MGLLERPELLSLPDAESRQLRICHMEPVSSLGAGGNTEAPLKVGSGSVQVCFHLRWWQNVHDGNRSGGHAPGVPDSRGFPRHQVPVDPCSFISLELK